MALPANRYNYCQNPGFEGISKATVETNMVPNPSIADLTGYTAGNATITASTAWALNGTTSLQISPNTASNDSYASVNGDTSGVRLGLTAGTYTFSGTIRLAAAQTGTIGANARTIEVFTSTTLGTYTTTLSTQAPNAAGTTRLSVTFTVPANPTEAFIRLYNGASSGNGDVFWDSLLLETGSTLNPYFDGTTAAAGDYTYGWTGTANNSTSIKQLVTPTGWTTENGANLTASRTAPINGTYSGRMSTGGDAYITQAATPGDYWTLSTAYKTTGTVAGTPRLVLTQTGGTGPTATTNLPLTLAAAGRYSVTIGPLTTGATAIKAALYAPTSGGEVWFDQVQLEKTTGTITRTNYAPTPRMVNTSLGGYGTQTLTAVTGLSGNPDGITTAVRVSYVAGNATPGAVIMPLPQSSKQYSLSAWVMVESGDSTNIAFALKGATSGGSPTTFTVGVWTKITWNAYTTPSGLVTGNDFAVRLGGSAVAPTGSFLVTGVTIEQTSTVGTFFDGGTAASGGTTYAWASTANASVSYAQTLTGPSTYFDGTTSPDTTNYYSWTGTANASSSQAEYRGIWIETLTGPPCPRTQVTVSGLGPTAGAVKVTRTADGETWTVPGWFNRSVVDADTDTDYTVPLGRPVTYTLFFNGAQIGQTTLTIASTSGWVQSPYDPSTAMPINTLLTDPATLTLVKGALDTRTSTTNSSRATVMGSARPVTIASQRITDSGATYILHAWKNATSDQFKALIAQAPIVLFRGLPSWGSIPGLAYLDAPAQEADVSRYKNYPNDGLTRWTLAGDLVQPVSRKAVAGVVTNDQVQTALAGTTYNTILARSGSKKNVEVKANPLGL